ncbi:response regulator containing a CheY-like receiver domain and an HD-GYP domain [Sphaerochaeta pleomorpha str. Grapes]|uniref:Response regulator containing a CheY-like receiver domain and an HD-GYP domain n=1 Tax=Sphaerochaeta pleomorpha (strain ATCC BAA-1885 / DSM 22778 / Grapes) TaxID=158190 RepID=G8QX61_SPHPG|nr:two-component system response regulator [Sphaerochaeta pleomorpha]AEV30646.1 response regulator containing a CheY-like receiver domain and an HD-GYP domain [Sphaerochaeta pleomorpha str. Grapes]
MNGNRETILIVDDIPDDILVLDEILKKEYQVKAVTNGAAALKIAQGENPPDLILLDIMMPVMDGYETLRQLNQHQKSAGIPVIFLTAKTGPFNEKLGLDLGAEDYISKPPSPPIVLARIHTHLRLKKLRDIIRNKNEYLEMEIVRRTQEIGMIQDVMMMALGSLAETRDNETGNHIRRTQNYIRVLAQNLTDRPRFSGLLTDETIELFYKSAPLHDIGKVGIPDRILNKPSKLTDEEFAVMKTHTTIGHNAILAAEQALGSQNTFLSVACDIAWSHHEKWNGSGYPRGLSGDEIPLAGRLMAIPDVYDALISERVYKRAFSHEEAVTIITQGVGSHFDPDIARTFLRIADRFHEIAMAFKDSEGEFPER